MSRSNPVLQCKSGFSQWSATWMYTAQSLLHLTSNAEEYWTEREAGRAAAIHPSGSTQSSWSVCFESGFPSTEHSLCSSFSRFCLLTLSIRMPPGCQAVPRRSRKLTAAHKACHTVRAGK